MTLASFRPETKLEFAALAVMRWRERHGGRPVTEAQSEIWKLMADVSCLDCGGPRGEDPRGWARRMERCDYYCGACRDRRTAEDPDCNRPTPPGRAWMADVGGGS